jgi:hypothetical protein
VFQNLLKKIARELDRSQIQYIVIGGQVVLLYGEPRLTKDIDITLGIGVDELEKVTNIVRKLKLKFLVNKIEKFALLQTSFFRERKTNRKNPFSPLPLITKWML